MKGHLSLKQALMHDVSFMNYRCMSHGNARNQASPLTGRRRGPCVQQDICSSLLKPFKGPCLAFSIKSAC